MYPNASNGDPYAARALLGLEEYVRLPRKLRREVLSCLSHSKKRELYDRLCIVGIYPPLFRSTCLGGSVEEVLGISGLPLDTRPDKLKNALEHFTDKVLPTLQSKWLSKMRATVLPHHGDNPQEGQSGGAGSGKRPQLGHSLSMTCSISRTDSDLSVNSDDELSDGGSLRSEEHDGPPSKKRKSTSRSAHTTVLFDNLRKRDGGGVEASSSRKSRRDRTGSTSLQEEDIQKASTTRDKENTSKKDHHDGAATDDNINTSGDDEAAEVQGGQSVAQGGASTPSTSTLSSKGASPSLKVADFLRWKFYRFSALQEEIPLGIACPSDYRSNSFFTYRLELCENVDDKMKVYHQHRGPVRYCLDDCLSDLLYVQLARLEDPACGFGTLVEELSVKQTPAALLKVPAPPAASELFVSSSRNRERLDLPTVSLTRARFANENELNTRMDRNSFRHDLEPYSQMLGPPDFVSKLISSGQRYLTLSGHAREDISVVVDMKEAACSSAPANIFGGKTKTRTARPCLGETSSSGSSSPKITSKKGAPPPQEPSSDREDPDFLTVMQFRALIDGISAVFDCCVPHNRMVHPKKAHLMLTRRLLDQSGDVMNCRNVPYPVFREIFEALRRFHPRWKRSHVELMLPVVGGEDHDRKLQHLELPPLSASSSSASFDGTSPRLSPRLTSLSKSRVVQDVLDDYNMLSLVDVDQKEEVLNTTTAKGREAFPAIGTTSSSTSSSTSSMMKKVKKMNLNNITANKGKNVIVEGDTSSSALGIVPASTPIAASSSLASAPPDSSMGETKKRARKLNFGRSHDEVRTWRNLIVPIGETQPMLDALRDLCAHPERVRKGTTTATGGDLTGEHATHGGRSPRRKPVAVPQEATVTKKVSEQKKPPSGTSSTPISPLSPGQTKPGLAKSSSVNSATDRSSSVEDMARLMRDRAARQRREKSRLRALKCARTVFVWNFLPESQGGLAEGGWRRLLQQAGTIQRLNVRCKNSFLHCEFAQRSHAEQALHLFQNRILKNLEPLKLILLEHQGRLEENWVFEIRRILRNYGEIRDRKLYHVKQMLEKTVGLPLDFRAAGFSNTESCLRSVPGVHLECSGPLTYKGRRVKSFRLDDGG
ncbi:unnamed protein product, partial [Amoebophrya sp. A25]|eukprot:GSA25T00004788001.1